MPCYYPIQAYVRGYKDNGKLDISFKEEKGVSSIEKKIPCGQCVGCRLERSRIWAMRCYFESLMHEDNSFITLTFSDEYLPKDWSINVRHFQLFMKRLRKWHLLNNCPYEDRENQRMWLKDNGIRYFHCGEYGECCDNCRLNQINCNCGNYVPTLGRPHYHACLFGFDFSDKELYKVSNGVRLYTSKVLEELWPFGLSSVGDVTFESAAYVARYIMKKITGNESKDHYTYVDKDTGEVFTRCSEYTTMSRRPGIGSTFYEQFYEDVYPKDYVHIPGRGNMRPPRFFDDKIFKDNPDLYEDLKALREENSLKNQNDNTRERLRVKEQVTLARLEMLKRNLS